jgi:hypothetical protein
MRSVPAAPLVLAVEGPSGAGKSRLVAALHRWTGWPILDEAWVRLGRAPDLAPASPLGLRRLEERFVAEEERRYAEARALADTGTPVLCDTGFLGPVTYTAGLATLGFTGTDVAQAVLARFERALASGRLGVPDRVLYLDTPPAIALARAERAGPTHPRRFLARHALVGWREREWWLGPFATVLPRRIDRLEGSLPVGTLLRDALACARRPLAAATLEEARAVGLALRRYVEGAPLSPPSSRTRRRRP